MMTKEEMDLVDEIRKIWRSGEPLLTPASLLSDIPFQISSLLNIIERLNEAQPDPFEKMEPGTYLN